MNRNVSVLCALVIALAVAAAASVASADDLKVDPVHSFVIFNVHHLQAGYVYGTFAGPSGGITYDASDPGKSSFNVKVDVDSLDTRSGNRDKDLKGPDFFNVKQFPDMTFQSTSVKDSGDNKMEVTGDLTLKGVKKSITITMEMTGTGQMRGQTRMGFRTEFTIKRSDYGMLADPAPVIGDDVQIVVAMEGIKQ
jgi:polyisoprenoid-binding protein YceI